jgi:hypothetical protein
MFIFCARMLRMSPKKPEIATIQYFGTAPSCKYPDYNICAGPHLIYIIKMPVVSLKNGETHQMQY